MWEQPSVLTARMFPCLRRGCKCESLPRQQHFDKAGEAEVDGSSKAVRLTRKCPVGYPALAKGNVEWKDEREMGERNVIADSRPTLRALY